MSKRSLLAVLTSKNRGRSTRELAEINDRIPNHSGGIVGRRRGSSNELVYHGADSGLERMKYEIANEVGVNLGPETTSRANGTVGGLMVKSMIDYAERHMPDVLEEARFLTEADLD